MKVICISSKGLGDLLPITIGKMYDVIIVENIPFSPHRYDDPSGPFYKIKCDNEKEKYILLFSVIGRGKGFQLIIKRHFFVSK